MAGHQSAVVVEADNVENGIEIDSAFGGAANGKFSEGLTHPVEGGGERVGGTVHNEHVSPPHSGVSIGKGIPFDSTPNIGRITVAGIAIADDRDTDGFEDGASLIEYFAIGEQTVLG
jgi:hypothetical protein